MSEGLGAKSKSKTKSEPVDEDQDQDQDQDVDMDRVAAAPLSSVGTAPAAPVDETVLDMDEDEHLDAAPPVKRVKLDREGERMNETSGVK